MRMFGKAKEKESNIARTPEETNTVFEPSRRSKVLFVLWNIFSIALYSCYTFFVTYKLTEKTFLSKVIIYLLIAYAVIFIILLFVGIGSRNRMKYHLKNYKSAVSFLKYIIQLINFVLSIITAISAFNVSSIIYAILSLIITLIFIFIEIIKIIIRKNIPLIKHNLLEIREDDNFKKQKEKVTHKDTEKNN